MMCVDGDGDGGVLLRSGLLGKWDLNLHQEGVHHASCALAIID